MERACCSARDWLTIVLPLIALAGLLIGAAWFGLAGLRFRPRLVPPPATHQPSSAPTGPARKTA